MSHTGHAHREDHFRALVQSIRGHLNLPLVRINQPSHNRQAEPYTVLVQAIGIFQLAKPREQPLQIILRNATPRVLHMHHKQTLHKVEARLDHYLARLCKFERVFDQIDQHLFQSELVSVEAG